MLVARPHTTLRPRGVMDCAYECAVARNAVPGADLSGIMAGTFYISLGVLAPTIPVLRPAVIRSFVG